MREQQTIQPDPFSDLPRNVRDYSNEQRTRVVEYLSRKTLAELRKRQGVIQSQIQISGRLSDGKREQVIADLQDMFDLESEAICSKTA